MTGDDDIDGGWRAWVERTTGGTIARTERRFTGGSRLLWFVDVELGGVLQPLVLRVDDGSGAFAGTELSLAREATVYRALADTPVPIARLVACEPSGDALLLERASGSSSLRSMTDRERRQVAESFLRALAALHKVDVDGLELEGFARPRDVVEHATLDLDVWERLTTTLSGSLDPLVAYAFAWLRAHPPARVARTVLVQGDTGPGNFVAEGGSVTALVDWELSHVGDPMDDIAWLDVRAANEPAFADATWRDSVYAAASGIEVDAAAVRYYTACVQLRCAVTTARTIDRGGGALGLVAYRAPHQRFLVNLAAALARAMGEGPVADEVEVDLGDIAVPVPGAATAPTSRLAKLRARDELLQREHAAVLEHAGEWLARRERDDRRAVFGDADDDELLARARAAGAGGDADVLAYLARRAHRDAVPWCTPAAGGPASPLPSRGETKSGS